MNVEWFHVGIVVSNLEEARERFTELLGMGWGPITESDVPVRDGEGREQTVHFRVCFSSEAPYIELIEDMPGTVWTCNEHSNIHHIAFYAGSLADESGRLAAARCPLEWTRVGDEVPTTFAYHRDLLGVRIEVLTRASQLAGPARP